MPPFPVFGRALNRDFGLSATANASMSSLIRSTQPNNLIAYWPLGETSGTAADDVTATNADGVYSGTFTLNQPGIGDGSRSTLFNGVDGRVSLAANLANLNAVFDPTQGTLACWCKVLNIGVWGDGTFDTPFTIGADANNRAFISKTSTANLVNFSFRAGGTAHTIGVTIVPATGWFQFTLTWDKVANVTAAYVNGVLQAGSTTATGAWVGALAQGFSAIGDTQSAGGSQPWNGWMAHAAVWKVALTAAEAARIAPVVYEQ